MKWLYYDMKRQYHALKQWFYAVVFLKLKLLITSFICIDRISEHRVKYQKRVALVIDATLFGNI